MIRLKKNGDVHRFLSRYSEGGNAVTQFCPMARQLIYKPILLTIAGVFLSFFAVGVLLSPLHWYYFAVGISAGTSAFAFFATLAMVLEAILIAALLTTGIIMFFGADKVRNSKIVGNTIGVVDAVHHKFCPVVHWED